MPIAAQQGTVGRGAHVMETKCRIIGWLLDDSDRAQVLIREENGNISLQRTDLESAFGQYVIQTGAFRRGNPIIDPVTQETLGYEMEQIAHPLVAQA
jgi:hypothetical protein